MKTQTATQPNTNTASQSAVTSGKNNQQSKSSFLLRYLTAICAMVVTLTLTASVARAQCGPAPTTTMVAWYTFDESSGPSGNLATGNSGTWNGNVGPVVGEVNGAASFDGATAYIDTLSSTATNFGPGTTGNVASCGGAYSTCQGDFSIALWIQVPANLDNSVKTILDKRSGDSPNIHGYSLYLSYDKLGLQLADGQGSDGYTNYEVTSPMGLKGTGWHHLAVTVHRTMPNGITFYKDGLVAIAAANPTDRMGSLVNDSPLRIGANTTEPALSSWFLGDMDELQIWNRWLTGIEIGKIVNAGSNGLCH